MRTPSVLQCVHGEALFLPDVHAAVRASPELAHHACAPSLLFTKGAAGERRDKQVVGNRIKREKSKREVVGGGVGEREKSCERGACQERHEKEADSISNDDQRREAE